MNLLKNKIIFMFYTAALLAACAAASFAAIQNGSANVVLGKSNFVDETDYIVNGSVTKQIYAVAVDTTSGRVYACDYGNNRILWWNSPGSLANGHAADGVLGQPDFTSSAPGVSSTTLHGPTALCVDGPGNLWVADTNNNRVLKYPAPVTTGEAATLALGQTDLNSNLSQVTQFGMQLPYGVCVDSASNVWVSDGPNHRILRYSNPSASGQGASYVIGQSTWSGQSWGTAVNKLWGPAGLTIDGAGNLWVADSVNCRVLKFTHPFNNNFTQGASAVLGQNNFTTKVSSCSQWGLSGPNGVSVDSSGNVWVADFQNYRVLEYAAPVSSGPPAMLVLGQNDYNSNGFHWDQKGCNAASVALDAANNVWVSDYQGERVLRYNNSQAVPAAESNLSAAPGFYEGRVNLSWLMPGTTGWTGTLQPGSQFAVQYSTSSNPAWDYSAAQINVSTSGVAPATLVSYVVTGLAEGSTYYFKIWHQNSIPEWSALSNSATSWAQLNAGVVVSTGSVGGPRSIARDSSGALYLAYIKQDTGGYGHVYVSRSADNGQSWMPMNGGNQIEQAGSYGQFQPSLVIDSSDAIHCVWTGCDAAHPANSQIKYCRSSDHGASWSVYINLSNEVSYWQGNPSLVVDSRNKLYCVWNGGSSADGGMTQIQYSYSLSGGVSWSAAVNIQPTLIGQMQGSPCAVVDSQDNLHAFWGGHDAVYYGALQIKYAMLPLGSSNWTPWVNVSPDLPSNNPSGQQEFPSAVIDSSGGIHCVWQDELYFTGGVSQVLYSSSTLGSGAWLPAQPVQHVANLSQYMPSLTVDSSNSLYCLWAGSDTVSQAVQIKISKNTGSGWQAWSNITNGGADQMMPAARWSGWRLNKGYLNVAWGDQDGFKIRSLNDFSINMSTGFTAFYPNAAPNAMWVSSKTATSLFWQWSDNSTNEAGYRVKLSSVVYVPSTLSLSGDLPANTSGWLMTGLAPNTSYQVYVEAFTLWGSSASFSSYGVTLGNPPASPDFPNVGVASATISFGANFNPPGTQYVVQRSSDGSSWFDLAANTTSSPYVDSFSPMFPDTKYFYRLRSRNQNFEYSDFSQVISTWTLASPPASIWITSAANSRISVSWTTGSNPPYTNYLLERSTWTGGGFSQVYSSNTYMFVDNTLPASTTYWYRVRAVNEAGVLTAFTANASSYCLVDNTLPTVGITLPLNNQFLNSLGTISGTCWDNVYVSSVTLTIQEMTTGYYFSGSTFWTSTAPYALQASVVGQSVWSFFDPAFLPVSGSSYTIVARALDGTGNWSAASTVVVLFDNNAPGQVTGFEAHQSTAPGIINLSWSAAGSDWYYAKPLGPGSRYAIEFSSDPYFAAWSTASAQVNISTYGVTPGTPVGTSLGLPSNAVYNFRLWAMDEAQNWQVIPSSASAYNSQFSFETVASGLADLGQACSIAVDKDGNLHVAYIDRVNDQLYYVKRTGTVWNAPSIVAPAYDAGYYVSIAVDGNSNPHIALQNSYDNDSVLKYLKYDGVSWSSSTVDSGSGTGRWCSLALDGMGLAHIAYQQFASVSGTGALKYASFDGTGWSTSTVDSTLGIDVGLHQCSVALDGSGNPAISYYDASHNSLKYAHYNLGWSTETVESGGGNFSSIALDGSGNPHIAYYGNGDVLKYAWFNGIWHTAALDTTTGNEQGIPIALDGAGNPSIAYYNMNTQSLKYARYDGTAWSTATVVDSSLAGDYASLAIDGAGSVHIAYRDLKNSDLKVAHWTGAGLTPPMGGNARGKVQQPYGLFAAAINVSSITWQWHDNSSNESGLEVHTTTSAVPYARLASLAPGANMWTEQGLYPNTSYYNYIAAVNNGGVVTSSSTLAWTKAQQPGVANFTNVSTGAVTACWLTGGNPSYTQYLVQYSTYSDLSSAWQTAWVTTSSVTVTSYLSPNATWYFRVITQNKAGVQNVPVVLGSTVTLAAQPAASAIGPVFASSITVNWTSINPAWTNFVAECSSVAAGGQVFGSTSTLNNSAQFANLDPNTTYYFQVKAFNSGGSPTNWTDLSSTRTLANVPGSISFSTSTVSSVSLNWQANANPVYTLYSLEASTGAQSGWSEIARSTATSFVHNGLLPDTTYNYRLRAINIDNVGTSYNTPGTFFTLANAPGAVNFGAQGNTFVSVSWTATNQPYTVYELRCSTGDTSAFGVLQTAVSTGPFVHSGLTPNTTYFYRVFAKNIAGVYSGYAENSAVTLCSLPAGINYSLIGTTHVTVGWSASSPDNPANTPYTVWSSTAPDFSGPSTQTNSTVRSANSVDFTGLSVNTTYYFKVTASNWQNQQVSTQAAVNWTATYCESPNGLSWAAHSNTKVIVGWSDTTGNPNGTSYQLSVSSSPSFLPIAASSQTIKGAGQAVADGLSPNTSYYAFVMARNWQGSGIPTTLAVSTVTSANPPASTAVIDRTSWTVTLQWQVNSNPAYTAWGIIRSTDNFASFTPLVGFSLGYTTNTFVDSTVSFSTTYYYKVRAFNLAGEPSNYDLSVTALTLKGPATQLLLTLPGEIFTDGVAPGKTSAPQPQVAGAAFTVTARALDANYYLSNTAANTVNLVTSDIYSAVVPPSQALSSGVGTFSVTLLTGGTSQVLITAGGLSPGTTSVFVSPAPAVKLQVLVPGENSVPGSLPGKAGPVAPQVAGTPFAVTANLVDAYWNKVTSTETALVALQANDPYSTAVSTQPLQNAATVFYMTLVSASPSGWKFFASDADGIAPLYIPCVSSGVPVIAGAAAKLLLLMPNETYAAGSPSGKSGTPQGQRTGVPFLVTVFATDSYYNLQSLSNPTVGILNSDPGAGIITPAALSGGAGTFSVTFMTEQSSWTVSAWDNASALAVSTGTAVYAFDGIAPDAVSDLAASPGSAHASVRLTWTSPGDNKMSGDLNGGKFVIRYSSAQIADFNAPPYPYYEATIATSAVANTPQSCLITGLAFSTTYYFALRAYDESSNFGSWSTAGANAQNFALPSDKVPPVILNNQSGYNVWRSSNPGSIYDVDFLDNYSGLASIRYTAYTQPGMTGTQLIAPTDIAAVSGAPSYAANWAVNFALLHEGANYISVIAQDLAGNTSAYVDAFYVLKDTTPPSPAPGLQSPFDGSSDVSMNYSWTISNDALSGMALVNTYHIDIAADASCTLIAISSDTASNSIYLPALAVFPGLHYWRVRARDLAGNYSAWSSTFSVTIISSIPSDPSGLSAVAISSTAIQWSWNDSAGDELAFHIYSIPSGLLTLPSNATYYNYVETGLTPNTSKSHFVKAYNNYNSGTESNGQTNTVVKYTLANPPAAPSAFNPTYNSAVISWDPNNNSAATQYSIVFATEPFFVVSSTVNALTAPIIVNLPLPQTTYYFRINAQNGDGLYTVYSGTVAAATLIAPPAGPANFAGAALSTGSILWTWQDTSSNELGFRVYTSTGGLVTDIAVPNTTFYVEAGLAPNGLYTRSVKTYNVSYESAVSNTIARYALANAPVNLGASPETSSSIKLTWSPGYGGNLKYFLQRSTDGANFSDLMDGITNASYNDTGLLSDTTYYYRAAGYNGDNLRTPLSGTIAAKTLYVPPKVITGRVTTASGKPITGVEITASKLTTSISYTVNTSTDGVFTVTLEPTIADGLYRIKAAWTAEEIISSAYKENIANGQDQVDFTLEVNCQLASVSGRVLIAKNAPASRSLARALGITGSAAAFIELSQNGKVIARVSTDEEGNYTVPNLLPGRFSARAYNGIAYSNPCFVDLKEGSNASVTFSYDLLNPDKVYAYPNPAAGVGRAVVHFETSGQDIDSQINIFTISGELVREVKSSQLTVNTNVWEYGWDLTNSDGARVASGVYLFQVRVKDKKTGEYAHVTKKLAVVR